MCVHVHVGLIMVHESAVYVCAVGCSPGTGSLHLGPNHDALVAAMWHPALCGIMIGALQLIQVPVCDKPIGSSECGSCPTYYLHTVVYTCN